MTQVLENASTKQDIMKWMENASMENTWVEYARTDLNLYWIKGALFCFSFWLRVLDLAVYSAFESTLNSTIVSYRIVKHKCTYDFLLVTNSNFGRIYYRFRDIHA